MAKSKPLIDAKGDVRELTAEELARAVPFSALPQAEQKMLKSLRRRGPRRPLLAPRKQRTSHQPLRRRNMPLKTAPWDPAEYLTTPGRIAAYLEAAFEDGDPALIAAALGDIARAKGMTQLAAQAGVTREALYKALSPNGDPRLSTLLGVMKALGIKLKPRAA